MRAILQSYPMISINAPTRVITADIREDMDEEIVAYMIMVFPSRIINLS